MEKHDSDKYWIYCDIYRNDELLVKKDLLNWEPFVTENDCCAEEEALIYADNILQEIFEKRVAEEMIELICTSGDATSGSVQMQFKEPQYGTEITDTYCNFVVENCEAQDINSFFNHDSWTITVDEPNTDERTE